MCLSVGLEVSGFLSCYPDGSLDSICMMTFPVTVTEYLGTGYLTRGRDHSGWEGKPALALSSRWRE